MVLLFAGLCFASEKVKHCGAVTFVSSFVVWQAFALSFVEVALSLILPTYWIQANNVLLRRLIGANIGGVVAFVACHVTFW